MITSCKLSARDLFLCFNPSFKMGTVDAEIMNLLDNTLSEEDLHDRINDTECLKSLSILLLLKRKRILAGKSEKIDFPLRKIIERENDECLHLESEVLQTIFFIIQNPDEGILQVITYVNLQLQSGNIFFNSKIPNKISLLLNEIILICKIQEKEYLIQDNFSRENVEQFLFYAIQNQNLLKIYVISAVLPNYINILTELHQLNFLHSCYLRCKAVEDLDVLCIVFNYIDKEILLNCKSVLFLDEFWQYIESCISSNISGQNKQGIFLLKKCVQVLCDSDNINLSFLQIHDVSTFQGSPKKIWQDYFILLDASKEKQLHLIWPCLTLLSSCSQIDSMWQICIYKKLLTHTQNAVVYFIASHILHNNIFFPALNKYFLFAINKNEYTHCCNNMFEELPNFCNGLKPDDFFLFIKDISEIIWVPASAWCLFANLFTEKLKKVVPYKIVEPIYRLLNQLPHVYIRTACISVFLNYIVRNFNWKSNFEDVLKLLLVLRQHDNHLFMQTVLKHVDGQFLNNILSGMEDNAFDINGVDAVMQMIKILNYEAGKTIILEQTKKFDTTSQVVIYATFFDNFEINTIEEFILEQVTELKEDNVNEFLKIIYKLLKFPSFSKVINSKMVQILNNSRAVNNSTISVALHVILNSYKLKQIVPLQITTDIKSRFFEFGKTDDGLCVLLLELYFFTEENPEIAFLENILHNQGDIIISKMFQCLSSYTFRKNYVDIIYFLRDVLNALLHLTKNKQFKAIILHYVNCIFSISFLQSIYETKMFDITMVVADSLLSLSETFPLINYYMSEKIKNSIFSPGFSREWSFILIPVIEELLLRGIIIKKDDRVEYSVCQEIYEKLEIAIENPNFIKISTRMSSMESMLHIISENPEHADNFTARLMKKYRIYFNKRYFPNSQIHLQKLRIIQALLTIYPFIKNERKALIDLIEESFCTEIHQPCVKQLMQWLLLSLVKEQNDYFDLIKVKINTSSKTQPSTIVAFIVVLLHLTLNKEETCWFSAVEALIPWSMGAHFKLRVYSQAAIKKLLEEGKRKHYEKFLAKFSYLEKSILSVIEASGTAFYETLKSDELIFSIFESEKFYSIETIYVDIPKLNDVTRTEWENVLKYKFITTHNHMDIYNKDRLFSNSVTTSIENSSKERTSQDVSENAHNIQRKIDPWKNVTEQQIKSEKISEFILIASLIDKSTNLGGLSRTCEVFSVKQLVLNDTKIVKDKEFKSLSMSSEDWVDAVEVKTSELRNYICEIRKQGYYIIGAEQTSDSICLDRYKFNKKTALVLGNEKEGIPPDIIPILDACVEIPQFGMVRSLNVHVAGATFIWEYAKQHLIN